MLTRACPILPSSDLARTKIFFARLGFEVDYEYPDYGYLILSRDEVELHFVAPERFVASKSIHAAFVRVKNANDLSGEFKALGLPSDGVPRLVEAEDKPWGICELTIVDHDGNMLRMGHILPDQTASEGTI